MLQVFALGVTADSEAELPQIANMSRPEDRQSCLVNRAAVALFVAACHGRQDVCSRLIQPGQSLCSVSSVFDKILLELNCGIPIYCTANVIALGQFHSTSQYILYTDAHYTF